VSTQPNAGKPVNPGTATKPNVQPKPGAPNAAAPKSGTAAGTPGSSQKPATK